MVRAVAFFSPSITFQRFHVEYFPTDQRPIPDPLLAHLLARSQGTRIENGETIEITLPPENTSLAGGDCGGSRQQFLAVQLTGGALVRTSVIVDGFYLTSKILPAHHFPKNSRILFP